ncbi:4-(cytidine 5'-diphospho)-2-C-methyl-D-erythritol kinase [Aquisediminimonas sediminicola]|uniref:4-(cytidine 5'-diphospho)-2-C-methyl-D-erythritol kinase n=1 Tax=Alteraquisediminimonas sediminicola TaxID=2676787 RepID=UPI001FE41F67|nr:4-(cytidine 5'-diphospho)-2-C-methyl-D-erythritol kinase [Aquisediminimonas sediminicola]
MATTMLFETAFAKINLALHVRRRRDDGYHDIETVFAFAQAGDALSAELADEVCLTLTGPFGAVLAVDEADNLVLRAARAVQQSFGIKAGAHLTLDKRLPVASGIGGGSADAAAALRLLARLWGLDPSDPRLMTIAELLGSDVPACLGSVTGWADGRGFPVQPVEAQGLSDTPLLLVNPGVAVATGPVFRAWDGVDRGPLAADASIEAACAGRNDLQPPAISLAPVIGELLALLADTAPRLSRMSGSGATCFALYESLAARDTAAAMVAARHPDFWTLATALR